MGREQTKRRNAKTTQQKPRVEKSNENKNVTLFVLRNAQKKRKQRTEKGKHQFYVHTITKHPRDKPQTPKIPPGRLNNSPRPTWHSLPTGQPEQFFFRFQFKKKMNQSDFLK